MDLREHAPPPLTSILPLGRGGRVAPDEGSVFPPCGCLERNSVCEMASSNSAETPAHKRYL